MSQVSQNTLYKGDVSSVSRDIRDTAGTPARTRTHARTRGPKQTEKAFMAQVLEAARLFGWEAYHPWLSKFSPRGFPDLVLCRPPRLIFAELKTETGKVTGPQQRWLDLIGSCPAVAVYLWRPDDLDTIVGILR